MREKLWVVLALAFLLGMMLMWLILARTFIVALLFILFLVASALIMFFMLRKVYEEDLERIHNKQID